MVQGEKDGKDRSEASSFTDLHVKILKAQKRELDRYCLLFEKSKGEFVREALHQLFTFYSAREREGK